MGDPLILVGRVAGAFGVRGEVRITAFTAEPLALLDYRTLQREDGSPGLTLKSGRAADGEPLGRVKAVQDYGAGDLLEIEPPEGPSWYLPFTREAVPEVRIAERKVIAVRPEEIE